MTAPTNEEMIKGLVISIPIIITALYLTFGGVDFQSEECSSSIHNPTNVTGGYYMFGRCYVPYYNTYSSNEKCGLMGLVCRDTEPYIKMNSGTMCFRLKDGVRC
jgi:hypothetical protein